MQTLAEGLFRLINLLYLGGWLMAPLFACSVLALAVCIDRWRNYNRAKIDVERLTTRVARLVAEERAPEALDICRGTPGPVAKVLEAGLLAKDRPPAEVRVAMADVGKLEIGRLEQYVPMLTAIAQVAPLLGLLGTVTGMIEVFQGIEALGGRVSVQDISGGIWKALLTTAVGLGVAIPSLLATHYFQRRIDRFVSEVELAGTELLNVFRARERGSDSLDETVRYSVRRE